MPWHKARTLTRGNVSAPAYHDREQEGHVMTIRKTGAADGRITAADEDGLEIPSPDGFSVTAAPVWGIPDEEGLTAENQAADE